MNASGSRAADWSASSPLFEEWKRINFTAPVQDPALPQKPPEPKLKELDEPQKARCREILMSLANFLEPFARISSHPLLLEVSIYDDIESLNELTHVKPLWTSPSFLGCCTIADATDAEKIKDTPAPFAIPEQPLPLAPENQWLNPSRSKEVAQLISRCRDKVDEKEPLDSTEVTQINQIFKEISDYLQGMQNIFDCSAFNEEIYFFKGVLRRIPKIDLDAASQTLLSKRVKKLYHAKRPPQELAVRRSSRRVTPVKPKGAPGSAADFAAAVSDRLQQQPLRQLSSPPAKPPAKDPEAQQPPRQPSPPPAKPPATDKTPLIDPKKTVVSGGQNQNGGGDGQESEGACCILV